MERLAVARSAATPGESPYGLWRINFRTKILTGRAARSGEFAVPLRKTLSDAELTRIREALSAVRVEPVSCVSHVASTILHIARPTGEVGFASNCVAPGEPGISGPSADALVTLLDSLTNPASPGRKTLEGTLSRRPTELYRLESEVGTVRVLDERVLKDDSAIGRRALLVAGRTHIGSGGFRSDPQQVRPAEVVVCPVAGTTVDCTGPEDDMRFEQLFRCRNADWMIARCEGVDVRRP